jgi:hypothetical protein
MALMIAVRTGRGVCRTYGAWDLFLLLTQR